MNRELGVIESSTETAVVQLLENAGWGTPFRPMVYVTSAKRSLQESGFHDLHVDGLAVDFGADSQGPKDALGDWLYPYAQYFLELIHETDQSSDAGKYVKNGQQVGTSFYGDATDDQHFNHVHLAMDDSGVSAMRQDPNYQNEVVAYQRWSQPSWHDDSEGE